MKVTTRTVAAASYRKPTSNKGPRDPRRKYRLSAVAPGRRRFCDNEITSCFVVVVVVVAVVDAVVVDVVADPACCGSSYAITNEAPFGARRTHCPSFA